MMPKKGVPPRPFNFSPAEWQQIRDAVHAEDRAIEQKELDRLLAEASQGMDEIWAQYEDIDLGAYDIDIGYIDDILRDAPDIDTLIAKQGGDVAVPSKPKQRRRRKT